METASQRIDHALETGAATLDLSHLRLTHLPPRLAELTSLTELHLEHNWLLELPDWLGNFTDLRVLRLDFNSLLELPATLADLTSLTDFRVCHNHLLGAPDWLAGLPGLTTLGLSECALRTLPNWIADRTGLTRLYLDENRIRELPDWLADLTALTELYLRNNRLTGLPDFLANLGRLTALSAGGCRLDTVPDWLATLPGLTKLGFTGNRIAALPDWMAGLTNLTELRLNNNRLTRLPEWMAGLTNLDTVGLAGCQLDTVPGWVAELPNLSKLYLDDNELTDLPGWLADRTALTALWLSNNRLTGLPDWLANLTNLTELTIGGCQLTALPAWLAGLTRLTRLDAQDNQLTDLPDWLAGLRGISGLNLDGNRLTELPDSLANLTGLTQLRLSVNPLRQLPGWICDLTGLKTLEVNVCALTALPERLANLNRLSELFAYGNRLTELPQGLENLTRLTAFDLDLGYLDEPPAWLGTMTRLTWLGISGCGTGVIPDWLPNLTNLSSLWLHSSRLTELPDWFATLSGLTELGIADNPLGSLPDWLATFTDLTFLIASGCRLTELPPWLSHLRELKQLRVDRNPISTLPDSLANLTHLEELGITECKLTELPEWIGELTNLRLLSAAANKLTTLPESVARLSRLTRLFVNGNQLAALPEGISELTRLTRAYLSRNQLRTLPGGINRLTRLTHLHLDDNLLESLPDGLAELPQLTTLMVNENPLVSPPPEIAASGSESVLAFLRARQNGSAALWESKLLVVGEGGVGKTSLVRALASEPHDPNEPSTHGLMIRGLKIDHPRQPVAMRLSTWDFGGQQIYHATHQFFLTNRSLFVLLWNSRLGWEQGNLPYWLDIITARAPEAPIILVATHIHDRPVDLPLDEIREKYPMIADSLAVDNQSRDGIDALRIKLAERAAQLPLMGSEWPRNWLAAADSLARATENHIMPARMWQLMSSAGVSDSGQQSYLARALHELGDILYYADEPELNQTVVLRPEWVNEYISKVLDSPEVAAAQGILIREHLDELWRDLDRGVRDHFLGMMERYDLSYRIEGGPTSEVCLVVERLQWNPPPYDRDWERIRERPDTREIRVVYELNTMPPGIPTWFIARSHRFSTGIHWRTGALLADRDRQHLALVRADRHAGTVELAVRGPYPANFFSVLDDGLNVTLERFPGLKITRLVPCPCEPECTEFFKYDNLRARLSRTPPRDEIECQRSEQILSVPQLILGITPSDRDAFRMSLDQFERTVASRLDEHGDYVQRMFLKFQRELQQQQEVRCPSVFAVVPADRRRLTGSAYEIHLYCEEPGAWHRLPEPQGIYPITQPHEWFRKLGPYLDKLIGLLKHAAPLVGPILGVAAGTLDARLKADCDLMKELANQLPTQIHDDRTPARLDPTPSAHAANDADFRALEAMFAKLDPDKTWGGLSKTTTPEGLTLYLCTEHAAPYHHRPQAQP